MPAYQNPPAVVEAQQAVEAAVQALVAAYIANSTDVHDAAAMATTDAFLAAVEALGLVPYTNVERATDALHETVLSALDPEASLEEPEEEPSALAKAIDRSRGYRLD